MNKTPLKKNPGINALGGIMSTQKKSAPKKLTGSFNAGLKTLRMLATKQSQTQNVTNDGYNASNTAK